MGNNLIAILCRKDSETCKSAVNQRYLSLSWSFTESLLAGKRAWWQHNKAYCSIYIYMYILDNMIIIITVNEYMRGISVTGSTVEEILVIGWSKAEHRWWLHRGWWLHQWCLHHRWCFHHGWFSSLGMSPSQMVSPSQMMFPFKMRYPSKMKSVVEITPTYYISNLLNCDCTNKSGQHG